MYKCDRDRCYYVFKVRTMHVGGRHSCKVNNRIDSLLIDMRAKLIKCVPMLWAALVGIDDTIVRVNYRVKTK